eukprot:ANDGO_00135.mRNA.1 hypothetical protein H257_18752
MSEGAQDGQLNGVPEASSNIVLFQPLQMPSNRSRSDRSETAVASSDFYSFRDVVESVFPLIQRFYMAYIFILGALFTLVFGLQLMFQAGFSFLFAKNVPILSEMTFLGLVFLIIVWFCSLLDSFVLLFVDAFTLDSYVRYRRILLGKPQHPRVELAVKLWVILTCDLVPLIAAFIVLLTTSDANDAFGSWYVAAVAVSVLHMLLMWAVGTLRDYAHKLQFMRAYWLGSVDGYAAPTMPSTGGASDRQLGSEEAEKKLCPDGRASPVWRKRSFWLIRLAVTFVLVLFVIATIVIANVVYLTISLTLLYAAMVIMLISVKVRFPTYDADHMSIASMWLLVHCGVARQQIVRISILSFLLLTLLFIAAFALPAYYSLAAVLVCGFIFAAYSVIAYRFPRFLAKIVVGTATFYAVILIIFAFAGVGWKTGVFAICMLLFTQGFLSRKGTTFLVFFTIYMLFILLLVAAIVGFGFGASQAAPTYSTAGTKTYPFPSPDPYSFCSYALPLNLTIIDYVLAAQLAYKSESNLQTDMTNFFEWSAFKIAHRSSDQSKAFFIHMEDTVYNRSVISIRGTANFRDTAEDLAVWMPGVLYSIGSVLIPTGAMMKLDKALSFVIDPLRPSDPYYQGVLDYVRENVLQRQSASQVVITGHSLGAGTAGIVAALTSTKAVSFSSPGLHYTSDLIDDLSLNTLRKHWTTITPENDVITKFDETLPDATVFSISCEYSMIGCHLITTTACNLFKGCGDVHNRGINAKYCVPEF